MFEPPISMLQRQDIRKTIPLENDLFLCAFFVCSLGVLFDVRVEVVYVD